MRHPSRAGLPALGLLLCASAASAQTLLETWTGPAGSRFGHSVAFLGDVTGDGVGDWIAGAPGDGPGTGSVHVYSGATRAEVYSIQPPTAWDYGFSVAAAGDLDADGLGDFVVGAYFGGLVFVHSGADGALLYEIPTPSSGDRMGHSVCGGADLDSDGVPDFAAGAPGPVGATGLDRVHVFSGADGSLIRSHSGDSDFGWSVAFIDDTDGDGVADLAVGAPLDFGFDGGVHVYSGATGALVRSHSENSDMLLHVGRSVADVGDLDGDGVRDYGSGGPCDFPCCCKVSSVCVVYSGATGQRIRLYEMAFIPGYGRLGAALAPGGDVDGDGGADLLAATTGGPGSSFTLDVRAVAFDGSGDGSAELTSYNLLQPTTFTTETRGALAGGVDVDGDGWPEMLVGNHLQGTADQGRVDLVTFAPCAPGESEETCASAPNSVGFGARIATMGPPSVALNDFRLRVDRLPVGQPAIFVLAHAGNQLPFGDGYLCVAPPFVRLPVISTGAGTIVQPFDLQQPIVPPAAVQPGDTRHFQLVYRDPQAGGTGTNATNGARVTFCQ